MSREQIGCDAADRRVGMRERNTRPGEQRRILRRDDALERLERLRDDPAVGVGELSFQPVARARRAVRLRGDTAPAPVAIARDGDGRSHAGAAVRLRDGDESRTRRGPARRTS